MKKLLTTVSINSSIERYTLPTICSYAKKIGAELLVIKEQKLFKKFPHYEKFQIYDLLNEYDRILYLDIDIIVTPHCPDIFEAVPQDSLAMFNEGGFMLWDPILKEASVRYNLPYKGYTGQYYNTGVIVIPQAAKEIFALPPLEQDVFAGCAAYDQPYINLRIMQEGIKVHELDYRFNRMEYIDKLTGEPRFVSWILHYAGIPEAARLDTIPKDIEELSKSKQYKRNVLISMGGGMGDQIAAEPVVRYVAEKVYPEQNIKVISDWPELFSHLRLPVCKRSEWKPDGIYYQMETLPTDKSVLWQFLSQSVCHTTDFASIACLRTIIPDEAKQIKLPVNERSFGKLSKLIKVPLSALILVHPGKGWLSKTFPASWWESVVKGLLDEGKQIAIIGKYISEEQGYVPMKIPEEAIDLLDLLNIDDLVALISEARCLISNDSAPIHIAGAFDNHIVLIPSCKHPDHVLPYRKGSKNYKTLALYKKLTVDALNNSPTNLNGETIDRVVGDILDYLPSPEDAVKQIVGFLP